MTVPERNARGVHTWQRDARRWDAFYGIVLVATETFLWLPDGSRHPTRAVAGAAVLLVLPLYLFLGRPETHAGTEDSPRAVTYVGCAVALFVPAAVLDLRATLAMSALGPQVFMLLSTRRATAAVLVTGLAPLAGWGVTWHGQHHRLLAVGVVTVLVTACSLAFGGYVQRIVDQSRDRAELIRRLDDSREEVARLSAAHGALRERERLAREIHDTLAQGFTSVVMLSQVVESELDHDVEQARRHVELIGRTARENLAESRALVAALSPAQLASASLEEAVRRLVERLPSQDGIAASVQVEGAPRRLPPAVEVVALRACQEALANVRKHAAAGEVAVVLAYTADALVLTVVDDGSGFDPLARTGGYGLPGMHARTAEIGGTARVRSAPGEGTTLTVRLPVGDRPAAGPAAPHDVPGGPAGSCRSPLRRRSAQPTSATGPEAAR